MSNMTKQEAFEKIVETLGTQAEIARLLGAKPTTVSYWRISGIPAEKAIELERASNGLIPRWASRPDLWEPRQ